MCVYVLRCAERNALHIYIRFSSYQLNAHFLYSITIYIYIYIYILHYNPQHVSSNTLLILRGQVVLLQPLLSLLSVNSRTVCRLRADGQKNIKLHTHTNIYIQGGPKVGVKYIVYY